MPSPNVDGLAYILFTSSSTGQPKGAMIERAGLNNHLAAKIDALLAQIVPPFCICRYSVFRLEQGRAGLGSSRYQ
ncbi:AMP-binding protein [Bradyrhizobium vignae]|uniref:AMP-binding protein n=1 Tax=Bradyrhizobium vignae TaxID=1549949 RepID=A0ABS4A7I3_9BRAD|nr:AMP-binding protein [Bradyrhizobium vignae]